MYKRYKAKCSECGHEFSVNKSIAQGVFNEYEKGCGRCPKCDTFLNLTFNPDKECFKTKEWNKWIKENKENGDKQ